MKSFKFSYFLLSVIAIQLALMALFFTDAFFTIGGPWVFYLGASVSVAGVIIPFFLKVDTALTLLNFLPGLAFVTGWGSWVWLHIIDETGPVINIWGVLGPSVGLIATISLYLALLIAAFITNRNSTGLHPVR